MVAEAFRLGQVVVLVFIAYTLAPLLLRGLLAPRLAAIRRADAAIPGLARRRFVVLVPARNEGEKITRLLCSLQRLEYPADRMSVAVVADNATDNTAAQVRGAGLPVWERHSEGPSTKALALRWLWERLQAEGRVPADAIVVVLDADCAVAPDFLRELDRAFALGPGAVQSYRAVSHPDRARLPGVDAALEEVRQQGWCGVRRALGLSAFLLGSGMAFRAELFDRLLAATVDQDGIDEDQGWQQWLIRQDESILWWPAARLTYEAASTWAAFHRQRTRWIGARLRGAGRGLGLLGYGLRRGRPAAVDHGLNALYPPRSLLVVAALGLAALAPWAGGWSLLPWWGWLGVAGSYGAMALAGLKLLRAPLAAYTSVLAAPLMAAVIGLIGLRTLFGRTTTRWEPAPPDAGAGSSALAR